MRTPPVKNPSMYRRVLVHLSPQARLLSMLSQAPQSSSGCFFFQKGSKCNVYRVRVHAFHRTAVPPTRLWRTPLRHRRSRAGPTSGPFWAGTRGCRTRSTLAPCRSRRRRQRLQALREQSPICNPCGLVFSHICMSCVVWDRLWRHSSRLEKNATSACLVHYACVMVYTM